MSEFKGPHQDWARIVSPSTGKPAAAAKKKSELAAVN